MPLFRVEFERDYTIREGFERTIEAATAEEARELAVELASHCDGDCPDDIMETGEGGAEGFEVMRIKPTAINPGSEDPA